MDLLTVPEIAAMLRTSESIALQVMGDTPYLHLGSGKVKNQPPDLTAGEFNRGE